MRALRLEHGQGEAADLGAQVASQKEKLKKAATRLRALKAVRMCRRSGSVS